MYSCDSSPVSRTATDIPTLRAPSGLFVSTSDIGIADVIWDAIGGRFVWVPGKICWLGVDKNGVWSECNQVIMSAEIARCLKIYVDQFLKTSPAGVRAKVLSKYRIDAVESLLRGRAAAGSRPRNDRAGAGQ